MGNDVRLKINLVLFSYDNRHLSAHHLLPSIPMDSKYLLSCLLISHVLMSLFLDFSLYSIGPLLVYAQCICYVYNARRESPLSPFCLPFLSLLFLHFLFKMNFRIHLSTSLKLCVGVLIGVAVETHIKTGRMVSDKISRLSV